MLRFFLLFMPFIICGQPDISSEDSIAYSVDLSDLVITGQYSPTHYKNVVHNIDVIDKEIIKKRGALSLESAISISPSIRLYEDPILGTSIRMRGITASNVAILIDGVPVIGRQNGSIDLSQISIQNVERIEIVEGPLSNIYGSNAAAGVINIITKKSQLKKFRFNSDHQIESIGIQNHQSTLGYKWKKLGVSMSGRLFEYNQFPSDSLRLIEDDAPKFPFNPKVQRNLGSQLRYDLNEEHKFILKYDYNEEFVDDFGVVKRPQFKPYANDLTYQTNRQDVTAIYTGKINSKVFLDVTTAYNQYDRVKSDKRFYIESQEFDPLLQSSDTSYFSTLFSRFNTAYELNERWSIMSGITYSNESGGGDRILSDNPKDTTLASFQETALYSEIKYKAIEKLHIAISGRWTHHSVYKNRFTPSIQGKYNINDNLSLKGGYAQGYRSPSLKELYLEFVDFNHNIVGNPSLEPEISHDLQATITYDSKKHLTASLNGYHTKINNRINLTQTDALRFVYDNIDTYRVFGFQPSAAVEYGDFILETSASLGFWSTNVDADNTPAFGRVYDMNNTLTYQVTKFDVDILINHRHIGQQPIYRLSDNEVTVSKIASYNMIDLTFSRSFWKDRISTVVGLRNILDIRNTDVSNGGNSGAHSSSGSNVISQGRSWFMQFGLAF